MSSQHYDCVYKVLPQYLISKMAADNLDNFAQKNTCSHNKQHIVICDRRSFSLFGAFSFFFVESENDL